MYLRCVDWCRSNRWRGRCCRRPRWRDRCCGIGQLGNTDPQISNLVVQFHRATVKRCDEGGYLDRPCCRGRSSESLQRLLREVNMTCPSCKSNITWDRRAFRRGFTCYQCGSEASVSEAYSRMLVSISLVVGFGLVWLPIFQGHGAAFLQSCVGFI